MGKENTVYIYPRCSITMQTGENEMLDVINAYLEDRKEDFIPFALVDYSSISDVDDFIRLNRLKTTIDLARLTISTSFKVIKHSFFGHIGYFVLFNNLLFGFISTTFICHFNDDGHLAVLYSRNSSFEDDFVNDYLNLPLAISNENVLENVLYDVLRDICLKSFMYSHTDTNFFETTLDLVESINSSFIGASDFDFHKTISYSDSLIKAISSIEDSNSNYSLVTNAKIGFVIYDGLIPVFVVNDKFFYNSIDNVFIPMLNPKVFQKNINLCMKSVNGHKHYRLFKSLSKQIPKQIKLLNK